MKHHLIFDFIFNILGYIFFIKYFSYKTKNKIKTYMIIIILFVNIIFTPIPSKFFLTIIFNILEFIFIRHWFYSNLTEAFKPFIRFIFIKYTSYVILFIFHSILLSDFMDTLHITLYVEYKDIICNSLTYIFYTLYIDTKRISFHNQKYKYYFSTIIILSLFTLSYVTLYICKNIAPDNFIIPLLFTAIYILIAIMITMYDRFILILNENAQAKISLEKAMLEEDYAQNIDLKLKELLSIRHDIKNHLNTIDGMLKDNAPNNARNYIHKIQNDFADTYIIATPCNTISNILNYKYQICLNKNIKFEYEGNFTQIYIDDYKLITILGNLIDNAITATTKLDELSRSIRLSITQIKSYLDITITNTHKENIKTLGNDFLSTKENHLYELTSMFHGIGLKNVRATTKSLNGELDIHYTDDTFFVSVMIPNYFKE